MHKVTSPDGTSIAYERFGTGPPLILVAGALCDRAVIRPHAERLGERFTAVCYDRRGRGDSGDTAPYEVEREIGDLGALVAEVGGAAAVYGHSSGAGLALHAAAAGLPITALVLHEPPYTPDEAEDRHVAREYARELESLLAAGRRGDAAALFMATVGTPPEVIDGMRAEPWWAGAEAMAPTLAYDSAVMGDLTRGGTVPGELLGKVAAPTLVLCGGASYGWMIDMGRRIAAALPDGRYRVLDGHEHVVPPEELAPVLAEFLPGR
ncbi:alpha/beta hydrolase [Actinomadura craniellae]|uniref:Alpha/beta hydrolase n=1 Tax=Actinomadura craniellae TaxID=2231787 RepID=A0A365HCZ0_9ACTN|nr:alpha/beta hydrolase [Actinomadura craniellae]RAY16133.1 alpha/beta hydrolase [Actinomadura craniellae]